VSARSFAWEDALAHLRARDPKLAVIIDRVGARKLEIEAAQSTFDALAEAIVYQQLTAKAAATIFGRVRAAVDPFEPARLLRKSEAKLRACGLSGAKLAALRDLSKKTLDGTVPHVDELHALDDDAIVERLTAVRGIGPWTVHMLLIFRLGRPDVLPVADYGVRKGFARVFKKRALPTPAQLTRYAERWRPFRTAASWYMWRALED